MLVKTEIVNFLKKAPDFISGQQISDKFHLSRAAIWKNIEELRREGYSIDAVSRRGYCLKKVPDKLIEREIQYGLNTKVFGRKIYCFDTLESTMAEAFRFAVAGEEEGAVICAEAQTKGKGRMGRNWNSPRGKGVYFSIILRPSRSINEIVPLTLLSAVAVCEAIEKQTGLAPKIKWPNDIFVSGRKVSGILTELSAEMDRVKFLIVGIGVNINTAASHIPGTATSLKLELKQPVDRLEFLKELLRTMEGRYISSMNEGMAPVLDEWRKRSLILGTRVKLKDFEKITEGLAVDINKSGALVVKKDNGGLQAFMSGDIIEMRHDA